MEAGYFKILLIEDNPGDARLIREMLTESIGARFHLECVERLSAGLERLAQGGIDVVLLDLSLPDSQGLDTFLSTHAQVPRVPIVVLTGFDDELLAAKAVQTGAQDYLIKGQVDGHLLARSMRYAIERGRVEEERAELLARERAARAEAEAANRAKDEFLATLSHELRTPLSAIIGWAELLHSGGLDETTAARAIEAIERNAKSQAQLIEDLLDVSRIITGKLQLNIRPVELIPIMTAAIDVVRPAAEAKAIQLRVILDSTIDPVSGDPDRLQQIVWNLLSNGVKFTPRGGRVEVRLGQIDSKIQIQVSDTGMGIKPEFLPYVFDRFRQADSTSTRAHGGLGLGLAIVRHLVELHGGTVQVESHGEGQGATFIVQLPLRAVRAPATEITEAPPDSVVNRAVRAGYGRLPALEGVHVLVVDDEPDARELLVTVLVQASATVTAVGSAAEALEAVQRLRLDALVSDIGMPEQDGYTLIRKVRSLEPERGGQIPAVALTAYARSEDRLRALTAGYQMHVPKPIEPIELVMVVASLTGRVRSSDGAC
jgi:signal transduction histidine kinase